MSYQDWFEAHYKKHKKIIEKLDTKNNNEIIKYFNYENMIKKEPNFCPLYKNKTKCHNIKNLNCYFCGCINFRLATSKSYCAIKSKYGKKTEGKNGFIHQDCSACTIPHEINFVKKYFDRNWKRAMKNVL